MLRLHVGKNAPKYYKGNWSFDSTKDALNFEPYHDLEDVEERYISTNSFNFLRTITQEEELVFRHVYGRDDTTYDTRAVELNDIRDLVLFLMPSEFLRPKFVEFMHHQAVYHLLHSLTIYFEYYLRMVEFVLIRRDEISGEKAQIQNEQTNDMKRVFSVYLSQYRMLVARNYSVIIKGEGDLEKFYHMKKLVNISQSIWDKNFHEQLLACSTQIVWIAMHRRAYNVIEMEMNRLFRSEHFVTSRPEYLSFTPAERSLLYGRNSKIVNYRTQVSPLIQELQHIRAEDLPILWIGERKYRGTDIRIMEMELEYIVPGPQLRLIDVAHGILGHPKKLYNTLLELDWPSVRYSNFSKHHDPYHIIRQPHLDIPKIDAMKMRQMTVQYEHFYEIHNLFETCHRQVIFKWLRREKIIKFYRSGGLLTNIVSRCEKELATTAHGPRVDQIIANYFKVKSRLRKEAQSREGDDDTVASGRIGNASPKEKNQVADMFYD
ncbi:uncharacterized protein LOC108157344 isoform X2 [Drosophila miranda]|uniref:uncharacterized protein LOC108157344 isoform X2 n=1 Tax=Drosophila miranda TaxID=7229 RepID=UPI00143F5D82|nr:uncharacterized protein LOC108157344 isoform X2 [Drosophila miranda]